MNNKQLHIQSVINLLTPHEKKRLRKAQEQQTHEYIYFNVSVFNAGAIVSIRQTNLFREKLVDDGYSFYLLQSELNLFTF